MAKKTKKSVKARKAKAVKPSLAVYFRQPFAALQNGFNSIVGYFK